MNQLIEVVDQFIKQNNVQFKYGKRLTFLSDVQRSIQQVGSEYRTARGAKIDIDSYLISMIETGLYSDKLSAKQTYVPGFPVRSEGTKATHKKLTEATLRKTLTLQNIVLDSQVSEKVIEMLSTNFLASDDSEKGIVFAKINDTEIGSLIGKDRYNLEELLNQTAASKFVDSAATKISKLAHRAKLRSTAAGMLEVGAKPKEIERLTDELAAFEGRSLKTGMKIPYQDRIKVEEEFRKLEALKGNPRSGAITTVGHISHIEDLSSIKASISKIESPTIQKEYTL